MSNEKRPDIIQLYVQPFIVMKYLCYPLHEDTLEMFTSNIELKSEVTNAGADPSSFMSVIVSLLAPISECRFTKKILENLIFRIHF